MVFQQTTIPEPGGMMPLSCRHLGSTLQQPLQEGALLAPGRNRVEVTLLVSLHILSLFAVGGWRGELKEKPGMDSLTFFPFFWVRTSSRKNEAAFLSTLSSLQENYRKQQNRRARSPLTTLCWCILLVKKLQEKGMKQFVRVCWKTYRKGYPTVTVRTEEDRNTSRS